MSEKLQFSIYKFKGNFTEIKKNKKPKEVVINIDYLTKYFKEKGYKAQQTQPNIYNHFELHLFFKRDKSDIKWKKFITSIVIEHPVQPIIKTQATHNESYILLLFNPKTNLIYATTGGFGHTTLQGKIVDDYGLEILSRIINANDKTLRSTKEKNFTGGMIGEVKFFRNDYNLNENENFGNVYQELHSSLNKKLLTKIFGFSNTEIKSECLCVAKNSFKIKKSISFKQLVSIIERCEDLIRTVSPTVEINNIKKITKGNKALIQELEKELNDTIFSTYSVANNNNSLELCHKKFDKYLNANTFKLEYKLDGKDIVTEFDQPLNNILQVLKNIKNINSKLANKKLKILMSNAHIHSYTSDGVLLTSDLLKNHFYTELTYKTKSYFLSNSEWFEIQPSFIENLNEQCQPFIDENTFSKSLKKWDSTIKDENAFNAAHIGENNFLVFDKFTPKNIEVCDILHWDNDNMYFIHAKAGFNNSMRDLCYQMFIAARKIKEDSKTEYSIMNELYELVKNTKGSTTYSIQAKNQLTNLSKAKFINLIRSRKIVFVLAVLDTAKSQRSFKQISSYNSNIAKFSLHELIKNMRNLGIDLQIHEIEK